MVTFRILGILPLLLMFIAAKGQDVKLKLKLKGDFSGWCYIVPTSEKSSESKCEYIAEKEGVFYINEQLLSKDFKIFVFRDNEEITDTVKYLSSSEVTVAKQNEQIQQYQLFKFYVPNKQEVEKSDGYWNELDTQLKYVREEKKHREKLIEKGEMRF